MLALLAAVALAAPDLPLYRNVAWIVDRGEPHEWWAVGPCRYGVREEARKIRFSGRAAHLGRWREVTVREVVALPDGLVADGSLVLAEVDGAYGHRVLDVGGGFHGMSCVPGQLAPSPFACDLSGVIPLDGRAPDGVEGTAVLPNTLAPGHDPAYDRGLGTLVAAASDAVARLAAGEDLPRGVAGRTRSLPATAFAVDWELTVIGRHPDGAALSAVERWTLDVPVGIDAPHVYHRRFDALGVALVATLPRFPPDGFGVVLGHPPGRSRRLGCRRPSARRRLGHRRPCRRLCSRGTSDCDIQPIPRTGDPSTRRTGSSRYGMHPAPCGGARGSISLGTSSPIEVCRPARRSKTPWRTAPSIPTCAPGRTRWGPHLRATPASGPPQRLDRHLAATEALASKVYP